MKKALALCLALAVPQLSLAAEWKYKVSESEMGDISYSATLVSEPSKSNKLAEVNALLPGQFNVSFSIILKEDVGTCFRDCLMEFKFGDEKISTIDFKQLSYFPAFEIKDAAVLNKIKHSKEYKFRITNVRRGIASDVYTFKPDSDFDPNKLTATKLK